VVSDEMIHPHVATCTDPDCPVCDSSDGLSYVRCSAPSSNYGDGRGCGDDACPRHGGRS